MSSQLGNNLTKNFKIPVIFSYGNLLTKTFLKDISKVYQIPIFNISDYIFQLMLSKEKSKTMNYLRECVKFKNNIGDWALLKIIQRRLAEWEENAKGIIFEDYPNKISQILLLNDIIRRKIVLKLDVDFSILLEVISGRRECTKCRKDYFINQIKKGDISFKASPPKENSKRCDFCNTLSIMKKTNMKIPKNRLIKGIIC